MKRSTWSFYDASTGLFLGRSFTGVESALGANMPAGAKAMLGSFNEIIQKVDTATGEVIDRRPTAPDETELNTWRWHDVLMQHVPVLTFEGRKADLAARIAVRIGLHEGATDRALRDLVLGGPAGPARDRMQRIENEVHPLRLAIDEVALAATDAVLDLVESRVFPPPP